ncbi:AMP-binding protein [Dongia deserti]|uniref:AMP-binding protein n=1 Tax=Dongia deserti TaxID=2268030 RepID=UPI000E64BC57|nr:AMP-binding protein [Dongia deserti]
MNLIETFLATAERRADRVAIVAPDGRPVTFAELAGRSATLAAAWQRKGIEPGDRVLLAMALGSDLYASIAALWRLGATVVFPEPAMGLRGLRHAIAATRPKAFLSAGKFRFLRLLLPELWKIPLSLHPIADSIAIKEVYDAGKDHPALISFTSGSTGHPKGIVRTHGFLAAQNACVAQLLSPSREDETDLVAFPVFVIVNLGLGITSVLPNWRLTRHDEADPAALAHLVRERKVTRMLVPPSICEVVAGSDELWPIEAVFTGGGPVFPDILERLAKRMPRADIISVYGSTEAEPIAHQSMHEISDADWQAMRTGAGLLAGPPIPEVWVQLLDDEILVAGEHVNKGYLDGSGDAANKIRIDGEVWHRTGDAGRIDDKGRLWLLGRRDAKAGGLFPFSVEVAARFWPGVRRVALVPGTTAAVLAVEGDRSCYGQWARLASERGDIRLVHLDRIPLDRRHRSKVDYVALKAMAT